MKKKHLNYLPGHSTKIIKVFESKFRIDNDERLINLVKFINMHTSFKTISCCSGHKKYPMTVMLKHRSEKMIPFELFTSIIIDRKRAYKTDEEGHMYIPETIGER